MVLSSRLFTTISFTKQFGLVLWQFSITLWALGEGSIFFPLGVGPPHLNGHNFQTFFTPLFFFCNWIIHIWNGFYTKSQSKISLFKKNHFSEHICGTRDPPPFMEKSILNFHVDYLNPFLRTGLGGLLLSSKPPKKMTYPLFSSATIYMSGAMCWVVAELIY